MATSQQVRVEFGHVSNGADAVLFIPPSLEMEWMLALHDKIGMPTEAVHSTREKLKDELRLPDGGELEYEYSLGPATVKSYDLDEWLQDPEAGSEGNVSIRELEVEYDEQTQTVTVDVPDKVTVHA